MSLFIVDVEADGPCPGIYSMVSFGVVRVDRKLETTFRAEVKPISNIWVPEALAVSGVSRDKHKTFGDPDLAMSEFDKWLKENSKGKPIFVSDNLAFDWQWINYYFHAYGDNGNPFGFSGRRIGDFYSGLVKDLYAASKWKKFKITPHTHDPVDDAKGNAEALIYMIDKYNINYNLD